MSESDAADWELVLAGDTRGLTRLFDRHHQRLFRHASRLLSTREDAKDAVGVALFELWRRRHTVKLVDGSPLPWLLNTVSNAALNLERTSRRYRALLHRAPVSRSPQPDAHIDETGVLAALKRLPEKERHVVILSVFEGYSEKETAQALGIPAGTVKSRLARAKSRLRGELEEVTVQ